MNKVLVLREEGVAQMKIKTFIDTVLMLLWNTGRIVGL